MPGGLNGDASVHGLHLARRQLALYAKTAHVASGYVYGLGLLA
jgi:hypothetical protein